MGPSKPAMSDATFAFATQLYRNEAKALQTQLQFNRNVPAVPENLALRFSNPRPIIIEKLKASNDQRNPAGNEDSSIRSSGIFSVVSEERLKLAVQLAKRDIRQRHLEEQVKQQVFGDVVNKPLLAQKSQRQKTEVFESPESKNAVKSQTHLQHRQKLGQPSKVDTTTSGAKVYLYAPNERKLISAGSDSPPTRDTGPDPKPNVNKKEDKNVQEVRRLQKELRSCVQKIEELIKKGTDREILDPDKEQQICTRRQKQAARSARMLYVLQQQVKEIQDDLEKLSPHKIKHTKKDLDSLLEKKQTPKKVKKCISAPQGKSPRNTEIFPARKQLPSPKGESKPLILKGQHRREPRKPPSARSLLTAVQKATSCAHVLHNKFPEEKDPPERNATSQGSLDALVRARTVKRDPILESGPLKKKGMLLPAKSQGMPKALKTRPVQPQGKQARFQETTIAFQLKENKRRKESSAPCVPPNPTSLPVSPKRSAWLEADTSGRVKALTDLSREEMKKIQKLRSQSASPTQCADKVEKAARECLEPVLDRTQQVAANADILSEKLLDDLLEDTAQELWSVEQRERLQSKALPVADIRSLESMLQRMEEIERYQEAVRRRFTQIVYSDLEFQFQEGKMEQQIASTAKRPTSPHPIQITKLIRRTEPEMDIFFEKHFDGNDIDENKEAEEKLQTGNYILQPLTQSSLQRECYVCVSVPKHMLQSISDYNSRYQHHLKLISHEAVGSFDPWQIAERYMNCLCVFEVNVSADEEVFLSLPRKGVGRGPFKFQTESQKQSVNWTLSLLVFGVHGFLRQLDKTKGYGSRMSWRSDYFSHLSMVLSQKPLREIKGNLNSFQKTVISR
ncbi:protein moonraker isoform X6 [Egretta garzetta]|uniref:protein moonraker isoform X6 n=1 Tax=Egretta garzetta TaxID=188379 RepID=UPI00163CC083|nr:protein moonraker isoform X6 [Egretta garzetta]